MMSTSLRKRAKKGEDGIRRQRRFQNRRLRRHFQGPDPALDITTQGNVALVRQTIRKQPSLQFITETLTSALFKCLVPTCMKDGEHSEKWEADFPGVTIVGVD
jgi:hypothetical protein